MTKRTASQDSIVSLKELREHFPAFIEQVAQGRSFTVVKRSKPIFQINPVSDEGEWQTIADFTQVNPEGVPAGDILKNL